MRLNEINQRQKVYVKPIPHKDILGAVYRVDSLYGYCPQCKAKGKTRERRKNGDTQCENGHSLPSAQFTCPPKDPMLIADKEGVDGMDWFTFEPQEMPT